MVDQEVLFPETVRKAVELITTTTTLIHAKEHQIIYIVQTMPTIHILATITLTDFVILQMGKHIPVAEMAIELPVAISTEISTNAFLEAETGAVGAMLATIPAAVNIIL